MGLLTSLKDSGESSVVVVEAVRPEPQRSMSPLLSTSCFYSSPCPSPTPFLPPFLSFLSSAQILRVAICPQPQPGKRREIPICQAQLWWWCCASTGPRGSLSVSEMTRCSPVLHSATQIQLCHCSVPARLLLHPPDRQTRQSLSNLPACRRLSLRLSAFPSDLSGHISPASLVCASCPESTTFIGRGPFTHAGTGGALLILINQSGLCEGAGSHCSFHGKGQ